MQISNVSEIFKTIIACTVYLCIVLREEQYQPFELITQ